MTDNIINISISRSNVFSYCTKVFKIYHRLFSWYPTKIILDVKPDSYQFQNVCANDCKYFWWYFNTFIIALGLGCTSCIIVILHASSVTPAKLTVSIGLLGMGVLYTASSYKIILNVNEIVQGFHCIEQILHGLEQQCPSKTRENIQNKLFWQLISRLMQFITVVFAFIPIVLVPSAIYVTVDPFFVTVPFLFPQSLQSLMAVQLLILLIRLYLTTVCVTEACRFYAIYFPTILQVLEYQLRCVNMVFTQTFPFVQSNNFYGLTFFKWYNEYQVANRISMDTLCSLLAILMGDGFFIFISCNIASFKCYGVIPLQVYWLMPTVSFACAVIHYYFLPLIIQVRTHSEKYLNVRKYQLFVYCYLPYRGSQINSFALKGFWNRKYYWKKLKSLKPVGFACGSFFQVTNIKSQYFYDVFLRSVDGIMLQL